MSQALETITSDPRVDALAEEIKATFVERVFNAREEIILAHHDTGKLLHKFVKQHNAKVTALVQYLDKIGCGNERTLWDCYKFYEKYPKLKDLDELGHGKNLSWNKIKAAISPKSDDKKVKVFALTLSQKEWDDMRKIKIEKGEQDEFVTAEGIVRINIKE